MIKKHKNRITIIILTLIFSLFIFQAKVYAFSYSIHLMWAKTKLEKNDSTVFPEDTKDVQVQTIFSWAEGNPEANIYVWYDGQTVTENQLKGTCNCFCGISDRLILRDVRELKLVKDNKLVFPVLANEDKEIPSEQKQSKPKKLPPYFYFDIWRVIIADHLVKEEGVKGYIVYSDFSITPLDKENLFDEQTKKDLDAAGLVLAKNNQGDFFYNYENGFYILDCNNKFITHACRLALIDINIKRAEKFLLGEYKGNSFEQVVFASYDAAMKLYHYFKIFYCGNKEEEADIISTETGMYVYSSYNYLHTPAQGQKERMASGAEFFFHSTKTDEKFTLKVWDSEVSRWEASTWDANGTHYVGVYEIFKPREPLYGKKYGVRTKQVNARRSRFYNKR